MGRQEIEGIPYHIDNYEAYIGHSIGYSEWVDIGQSRVNQFGEATNDHNPLHVDPAWAVKNGPFGGPIAHGFLTISMLSHLAWKSDLQPDGVDYGINLGFERVRFLAPVMVGDRIRMRAHLVDCKPRGEGRWWFKTRVTIETEKTQKAALSAVWLILFVNEALAGDMMKAVAGAEVSD
jgi:acyl dehydratase